MCLTKPKPEYKGKPLSQWVAETQDEDSMVRLGEIYRDRQEQDQAATRLRA